MAIYGFRLWFNWEVRQLPLLTYGRRKGSSYLILNYFKLSFWGSMSETQFFAHSHPQAFFHSDPENFLVFSFKLYVKLLWHPRFFFPFFSIEFERWMMGWMEKKESEGRKGKMVWKWRGEKVKDFGWVEKEDKDILVILNIICYLKEGKREYSDGTLFIFLVSTKKCYLFKWKRNIVVNKIRSSPNNIWVWLVMNLILGHEESHYFNDSPL